MNGTRALGFAAALIALPALTVVAPAQSVGRNQVQDRDFEF